MRKRRVKGTLLLLLMIPYQAYIELLEYSKLRHVFLYRLEVISGIELRVIGMGGRAWMLGSEGIDFCANNLVKSWSSCGNPWKSQGKGDMGKRK